MGLTTIGNQKTPGRPVEIAFAPQTGLPSATQELLLIGHRGAGAASGSSGVANYAVVVMANVADPTAASGEAAGYFGTGSELTKMVVAAVNANAGGSSFPTIKCIGLASGDADFGSADAALVAAEAVKAEFIVSPYDGNSATLRNKLVAAALLMSGAQRVENNQFGTIGVVFNRSVTAPASLPIPDSQYLLALTLRDTGAPALSIGEAAAACAAKIAGNAIPFNPMDGIVIPNVVAPALSSDYYTVGAGLESEAVLNQGWTPLRVLPNGSVAFVRTVLTRITVDGITPAQAYYDVQDFQVLYYWRKTIFARLNQSDFKQVKASNDVAKQIKSELVRLAQQFEAQTMFQAVSKLGALFQVVRSLTDRYRFDVLTPVNVIPGLHTIAVRVEAGTLFDTVSI